jgi:hypothetical protein
MRRYECSRFADRLESKILIATVVWGCYEIVGAMTDQNFLFWKRLHFFPVSPAVTLTAMLDNLLIPDE